MTGVDLKREKVEKMENFASSEKMVGIFLWAVKIWLIGVLVIDPWFLHQYGIKMGEISSWHRGCSVAVGD